MPMLVKDYVRGTPSFLRGMARVLDIGNTLDEYPVPTFELISGPEADAAALAADARRISDDLRRAYAQARAEAELQLPSA